MLFFQEVQKLRHIDSIWYRFMDVKHIIRTVLAVIFFIKGKSEGVGIVIRFPQLVNVPVSVHVTQYHDPDISSETLDLLQIPKRKCVVVATGEEYGARSATA